MRDILLEVPSSVTIRSVASFSDALRAAIAAGDSIVLDADPVAEVDLSFLQLVCAARAEPGKAIRLAAPANPAVTALLTRAGFLTDPTDADVAFWFHGALPQ
jgi:hypothetical protein